MFEKIKNSLVVENIKLKKKVNKLELDIEILKDKRIDELLNALNKKNKYDKLYEDIKILEIRYSALKETLKEISNGKTHKS